MKKIMFFALSFLGFNILANELGFPVKNLPQDQQAPPLSNDGRGVGVEEVVVVEPDLRREQELEEYRKRIEREAQRNAEIVQRWGSPNFAFPQGRTQRSDD